MNHKKGLAIFLSIACAAILGSVFLLGKSPEHTFTPEVTESVSSNSWEERNSQTDSGHVMSKESADKTLPEDSSAEDPVQTVISEDTEQVITELTPIEDKAQVQANTKPTAPPPDEEKQGRLPKCDMLPNAQTSVAARKPVTTQIFKRKEHYETIPAKGSLSDSAFSSCPPRQSLCVKRKRKYGWRRIRHGPGNFHQLLDTWI